MRLVAVAGRDEETIRKRNRAIERLHALPVDGELRRSDELGQVPFGLKCYRNTVILRLRVLEEGVAREYNAGNFVCALILTRQLVETAAHFIKTDLEVKKELGKKSLDLQRVHDRILNGLLGSKLKDHSVVIEPEQIMNCIDATDKLIRQLMPEVAKVERKPIRSSYDFLSELVHPNSYAFLFHLEREHSVESGMARFRPEGKESLRGTISGSILGVLAILDLFLLCELEFSKLVAKLVAIKE